jgi:hypothetical protein
MSTGLDNGPVFVAEVVQLMTKGLGITWKLHMACHPQSSGKMEHMNKIPEITVGKTMLGDTSVVGSVTTHSITKCWG